MAEIYQGIKFNYKNIGKTMSKSYLLPELKKICTFFKEKKLAPEYLGGSSGNLSFRTRKGKNEFIITASHTALKADMSDTDFSEVIFCDEGKNYVEAKGVNSPSSETLLHFLIYKNRPKINAVFHGHSSDILKNAKKLNILITSKEEEYGTIASAYRALKLIKESNFIILKNHGFVSVGKTINEALENIKEILNKI